MQLCAAWMHGAADERLTREKNRTTAENLIQAILLARERINRYLANGFVHLGSRAADPNPSKVLAFNLDWKPALVRERLGKHQNLVFGILKLIGGGLRGLLIKSGMPGLFLGELNGVESGSIAFLEKEQITTIVDDADRDVYIPFRRFGLGGGDHGLNGCEVQIRLGRQSGGNGEFHT